MFNRTEHTLWTESYRPTVIENYVGNKHIIDKVKIYLANSDIPHLLLFGQAGTGKCLDYSEKVNIEIELTDEEYERLKKFEI